MRGRTRRLGTLIACVVGMMAASVHVAWAQTGPTLVVLVRHAEKASPTDPDPSLSEAGARRAQALADAMSHATPNAIFVTSRKRTAETAVPIAQKAGVSPTVMSLDGAAALHVKSVADAVRREQGVVLVVGHSNTVPAIVRALGGPALADICDASYAALYLLTPARDGKPASLVTASYGAPDAPGATTCAGMVPK